MFLGRAYLVYIPDTALYGPVDKHVAQVRRIREEHLLIGVGGEVDLFGVVVQRAEDQVLTELPVEVGAFVSQVGQPVVAVLEVEVYLIVTTGDVVPGKMDAVVHPLQAVVFFHPPLVEIPVDDLEIGDGKDVPTLLEFEHDVHGPIPPVHDPGRHVDEQEGIHQLFVGLLEQVVQPGHGYAVSCPEGYLPEDDIRSGLFVALKDDAAHQDGRAVGCVLAGGLGG